MKRLDIRCPACRRRDVLAEDAERQCQSCGHAWTDETYDRIEEEVDDDRQD